LSGAFHNKNTWRLEIALYKQSPPTRTKYISLRRQREVLQAVRPVLQEGFPTAGNWLSRWGFPP